ncbi:MAG: hypothetical protein KF799_02490 [Bdellovibrionales bacterium]|nr:hypothetical protein [Bdellovibrionales bacterium]
MKLPLVLAFLFMTGCALMQAPRQSKFIKEVDWPITQIRGLISSQIPVGTRSVSSNGREILSEYFVPGRKVEQYKDGHEATDRYYVQYTILGDRRPYDIAIIVTHQRRMLKGDEFIYQTMGYHDQFTQELAERLRRELSKRREERNIIDDFRVY